MKHNRYDQLRAKLATTEEVVKGFIDGDLIEHTFWTVKVFPDGSRVLFYFDDPVAMYCAEDDKSYCPTCSRVSIEFTQSGGDYCGDVFWGKYTNLVFIERLRSTAQ